MMRSWVDSLSKVFRHESIITSLASAVLKRDYRDYYELRETRADFGYKVLVR